MPRPAPASSTRVCGANEMPDKTTVSTGRLAASDIHTTEWLELSPKSPRYLLVPRDDSFAEEYEAGWRMTEVFPTNSVGIVTARDKLAIRWTSDEMKQVAAKFRRTVGRRCKNPLRPGK